MTFSQKSGNAFQRTLGSTVLFQMSVGKRTSPVSLRDFPVPLSILLRSGNTGLTGAPEGAGPMWGRAPAPFSPPSPANRPRTAAPVSQQLCLGVFSSDPDPRGPCGAGGPRRETPRGARATAAFRAPRTPQCLQPPASPREAHSCPGKRARLGVPAPLRGCRNFRLREARRRDPGQKGGVRAAGVWSASTFPRAARARGGAQEVPPPTEGQLGAALGKRARTTYRRQQHTAQQPVPRARFRVRSRDLSRHRPARGGAGSGCGVRRFEPSLCPASRVPAGALRSARPPRPVSRGSCSSAAAFFRSSRSSRKPVELGAATRSGQGHLPGLHPHLPSATTPAIPHEALGTCRFSPRFTQGESKAQEEEIICRGSEPGSEPRTPGSRAALSHPLALPAEPQFPFESCPKVA